MRTEQIGISAYETVSDMWFMRSMALSCGCTDAYACYVTPPQRV